MDFVYLGKAFRRLPFEVCSFNSLCTYFLHCFHKGSYTIWYYSHFRFNGTYICSLHYLHLARYVRCVKWFRLKRKEGSVKGIRIIILVMLKYQNVHALHVFWNLFINRQFFEAGFDFSATFCITFKQCKSFLAAPWSACPKISKMLWIQDW